MSEPEHKPCIAILANYPVWLLDDSPVPPFNGHYATWLTALAEAFCEQDDFDIHWVTLSRAVRKRAHLERMGQHFHILPRMSRTLGLYSFYLHDRFIVARELRRIRPDLVHAWGSEDCYGLCSRDFSGKRLISSQGMLNACKQRASLSPFLSRHSRFEAPVYRAHRWITAESPWAADRIRELSPEAKPMRLEYAAEKRFFEVERQLSAKPSCLFAGSDVPLKNVDLLIEAFSRPELAHVQLNLAGISAAERPNLAPNIRALGRLNREALTQQLAASWCLAHPSLVDASPNIVKEARVVGLPVALTEECGNKHYVVEGMSGFVCGVRDVDAFVRAILTMTQDRETSLRMGAYGVEECRKALCADTMYTKLSDIYHALLRA